MNYLNSIRSLYDCGCDVCNSVPIRENNFILFTEQEYKDIIKQYFWGVYNPENLPIELYMKNATVLSNGVAKGFGIKFAEIDYTTPDYELIENMRLNTWIFSGAKTYQETVLMNQLLLQDGMDLETYLVEGMKILTEFNEGYLIAEYNAAVGQSINASKFASFIDTKNLLPYLTYVTVGDLKVRPEHRALDHITRRVDDSFWKRYSPPNGWNCRCTIVAEAEGTETSLTNFKGLSEKQQPLIFRSNSYYTKQVFTKEHPYFDVIPKHKDLAKQNFNLPIPQSNGSF